MTAPKDKPLGYPHPDVHNIRRLYDAIRHERQAFPDNVRVQTDCDKAHAKLTRLAAGELPRYIKVPWSWRKLLR